MIAALEFNESVGREFTSRLAPLGLHLQKGHNWVEEDGPIRRVFALYNLKGLSLAPKWGFSLDFVPHLGSGDQLKWHRTPKSAIFDLTYDPIDYTKNVHEWSISRFVEPWEVPPNAAELAERSLGSATTLWGRGRRIEDVASLFEEWRRRPAIRFEFTNYVQAPLAYAFVLARLGREPDARHWLKQFLAGDIRPEAKKVLMSRFDDALRSENTG